MITRIEFENETIEVSENDIKYLDANIINLQIGEVIEIKNYKSNIFRNLLKEHEYNFSFELPTLALMLNLGLYLQIKQRIIDMIIDKIYNKNKNRNSKNYGYIYRYMYKYNKENQIKINDDVIGICENKMYYSIINNVKLCKSIIILNNFYYKNESNKITLYNLEKIICIINLDDTIKISNNLSNAFYINNNININIKYIYNDMVKLIDFLKRNNCKEIN